MASNPKSQTRKTLPIDLALQGGGSHGAFTWGVLDRILEEDWFEIDGISGTSAGAMNAAILAAGMATGGRQTAREMLTAFWRRTADAARFSPFKRGPLEVLTGKWTLDNSPAFIAMDLMARLISPYSLGGAAGNPLRDILTDLIDFDAGGIATGEKTIEETGWDLFRLILDVASGRTRPWSDRWGIHNDLTLFNPAPVT